MSLLGDDGRGFDLARRLESSGVWRSWLGDSLYASFVHSLNSPSSWEAFMRTDDSKSRAQIQLQLRVRALLFDKVSGSLFLRSNPSSSSSSSAVTVSKLNPSYLQLHGDDVYYTLDGTSQDGVASHSAVSKSQAKLASSTSSRYSESEIDGKSQRFRHDELPETWYNQFIEKYRISRSYKPSFGECESNKRTPEEMSAYLRLLEKHKRRRVTFKEDQYMGYGNSILESASNMHPNSVLDGSNSDDDTCFFPETMFTFNCVPDSALPPSNRVEDGRKVEFYGIFDTLPQVMTRSPVMIERLGIRPEYLGMEQGGNVLRGKNGSEGNKKCLSPEQASKISQKILTRMLINVGFEGTTEVPLEVFSQVLGSHICKLGRTLKVLADSYRKQCSAVELIKMFLHTSGYSNFTVLAEHVKDGTRNTVQQPTSVQQMNFAQQTQQQVNGLQSQMQSQQHQNSLRIPPQITRQMPPQMQQMVHSQNLMFQQQQQQQQQQLDRIRRRQPSTPRPNIEIDKDRPPMVQVKLENPPELPLDNNAAFNTMSNVNRHPQMQFRQQQLAAFSNLHAQSGNQFRQLANLQIPQMQNQNIGGVVRAPPVKVEGFQELMGGDSSLKHDEENKLTSPTSK